MEYKDRISSIIDGIGIDFEDTARTEAVDYFSELVEKGSIKPFDVRTLLVQSPEYQKRFQKQSQENVANIGQQARGNLGQNIAKSTKQFVGANIPQTTKKTPATQGLPIAERIEKDIGQKRQSTFARADIAAQERGIKYQREDTVKNTINQYNQAVNQYNNLFKQQQEKKAFEQQKYSYRIQLNQNRMNQIESDKRTVQGRDWELYMANMERKWRQEDMDKMREMQKKQNWANLIGFGVGTGIGALVGMPAVGGTIGQGLANT